MHKFVVECSFYQLHIDSGMNTYILLLHDTSCSHQLSCIIRLNIYNSQPNYTSMPYREGSTNSLTGYKKKTNDECRKWPK